MAIIQARDITLLKLKTKFGLRLLEDEQLFREWQDDLPEITESEKLRLDRAKASWLLKFTRIPPVA